MNHFPRRTPPNLMAELLLIVTAVFPTNVTQGKYIEGHALGDYYATFHRLDLINTLTYLYLRHRYTWTDKCLG